MKLLNFGSLNLDYVYSVPHFVSAGETLASRSLEVFAGGKGLNQSIAIAKAGAVVYHAGAVGRGDGSLLLDTLESCGVDCRFIEKVDSSSGHAIIQVDDSGENCILLNGGANSMISEDIIGSVLKNFGEGDWLILQNEICNLPCIMKGAKERGMRIILNPSPVTNISQIPLELVDIFLLNEVEAQALSGKDGSPEAMLKGLSEIFPQSWIVLTLGSQGVYCLRDETVEFQAAFKVTAVDTTAAGDTFTGFFIAELSRGAQVADALKIASKAASIAVSRKGAAPSIPNLKEVMEQL